MAAKARSLVIVRPVIVQPHMLVSDVLIDDYQVWNIDATYAANERVVYERVIYESSKADNKGLQPDLNGLEWVDVEPVNRWRAFDLTSLSTRTSKPNSMWFEIRAGVAVSAVTLRKLTNAQVMRVVVTDPNFGEIYRSETALVSVPDVADWWVWFFGERTEVQHAQKLDLPSYPNATIRIELEGGPLLSVGVVAVGHEIEIGIGVEYGVRLGMRDFSQQVRDRWGNVRLAQGNFSETRSLSLPIKNEQLATVKRTFEQTRSTPLLWLVSDDLDALDIWGWFSDFSLLVKYAKESAVSIEIEGVTDDTRE